MHAGHNGNVDRYKQINEDLAASERTIQQLEDSSNDNAEQYKFLQEMRGYVGDLLECFSEKVRENSPAVSLAVCCFVSVLSPRNVDFQGVQYSLSKCCLLRINCNYIYFF